MKTHAFGEEEEQLTILETKLAAMKKRNVEFLNAITIRLAGQQLCKVKLNHTLW